jgi:hypothetical protein
LGGLPRFPFGGSEATTKIVAKQLLRWGLLRKEPTTFSEAILIIITIKIRKKVGCFAREPTTEATFAFAAKVASLVIALLLLAKQ